MASQVVPDKQVTFELNSLIGLVSLYHLNSTVKFPPSDLVGFTEQFKSVSLKALSGVNMYSLKKKTEE